MKKRRLSILLSIVMLFSLLPTTALAATYNDVKVNGVSLGDGKYLASNSATDSNYSNTEPSSYVAWYKDGTLTLNGYKGTGIVLQGAPAADLIIKLIGDNTITTTTNEVGIQGNRAAGSITITADSGSNGNLTIDMTHSTRPVFGINGYANSVTITGSADVKITAVATATDQESFGIKSSKAVSILDSASVGITCKTPNSTSRSDTCNGIYSDTGVTINTDGKITIDVSDAGDEAYSYGIRSMSALTLKKVGGMTVKWKKSVAGRGIPLSPSSASFDSDAYVTHVDETNCIATYMPKVAAPAITTGNAKVTAPVAGQTPSFIATSDEPEKYSVELLKWIDVEKDMEITPVDLNDPASGYYNYTFKGGKEYTAVVKFTAVGDNTLSTSNSFTINGETTYWTGNGLKRCHTFTATGVSVATYDLTTSVNGGHGTISAGENGITEGTSKIITFTPDSGYEIDKVMVNGTETTVTGNTLTVTMDGNKNVVVTYKAIEYNITVTDGKATVGAGSEISKATQGTAVTLTANVAPSGKVFDKWEVVSGGITLADANSATTTFTMPASAVSVKATYKTAPVTTYNLTTQVNGGHGTISASKTGLTAGSTETITFNPEVGYEIDTVTVNGTATSVSGNTLNVTMNENKTVVVTYKAIKYNITVTDGKATIGAGSEISKAAQGTIVTLTAKAAPSGKVFDKWEVVSGGITLADANSATTTFTMPASTVSVKATYKTTPVTTYDLTTQVNGGHGTISASKTGLTAGSTETITFNPEVGYEIDTVTVNGTATSVSGNTLNVTMNENKTVVVTYKAIEYNITVTDGKATIGAGSEISKAAQGTIVTLTANAAPSGKVFDKWEVVSGGITLADVNSATTTFTMPASAVSVKATYKTTPVTTYTVSFDANGGTGTMANVPNISGSYTLPANGFTAPSGKQFKGWATSASGTVITGTSINVTENTTLYAIWIYTGGGSSGGGYVPKTQKPEIKAAAGGKTVLSKDGTTLTITADAGKVIDKVLLNGKDMGAATELKGLKTGDKVEVIFKDQVEGPTKEELDKAAKEAAGELVLTARSAKLKNGSVKIMLKGDLKAITDAGYTVKYKFYRSTKKSAGYKAVLTKKAPTYVNTYGKQGTMYYYKAKVMIYDKEGNFVAQTALKQCKYASRLWTK